VHQVSGARSWIPFEGTWRNAGQKASTTRPNSAASCVIKATADSEAA
jgi:hypothetical protein